MQSQRRLWNQDTLETRYFLSSLAVDAATFARYIRAHWGIENQLHWCLDVVFNEDASRIRKGHAPRNFSLLRRFVLNLLRQDSSNGSLVMKRYKAGLDDRFMLQILTPLLGLDEASSTLDFDAFTLAPWARWRVCLRQALSTPLAAHRATLVTGHRVHTWTPGKSG